MPDPRPPMDDWRAQQIAEAAAQKAVEATFRLIGIDIRDQDGVNAMRDDLSFVRRQREAREQLGVEARKGVVAGLLQGLGIALAAAASTIGIYLGISSKGGH